MQSFTKKEHLIETVIQAVILQSVMCIADRTQVNAEKKSTVNEIWTKVTAGCRNWKSSIFLYKGIRASPSSLLQQHHPNLLKTFCVFGAQSFQTLNVRGFFSS